MKARTAIRPAPAATVDRSPRHAYASRRARLDDAVSGRVIQLPHRATLERSFGRSLAEVPVHCDDCSRAALADLHAEAAAYRGHILLATPAVPVRTIAHEVAHVLQSREASDPFRDGIEIASAAAEVEAESLAARIEQRAGDGHDPLAFVPLRPEVRLAGGMLALRTTRTEPAPAPARSPAVAPTRAPRPATEAGPASEAARSVAAATERAPAPTAAGAETGRPPVQEGALAEAAAVTPAAPAPGVTPEQVAARQAAIEEARARLTTAESAAGVVEAFADAPPTLKAQMAGELDSHLNGALAHESQTLAEQTPPVEARIEHGAPPAEGPVQISAPPAVAVTLEAAAPPAAPAVEVERVTQGAVADPNRSVAERIARPEGNPERRGEEVGQALRDVHTANPGIEASAGPPPAVPLEGAQDPQRIENQSAAGRDVVNASLEQARSAVVTGPGAERVQPASMNAAAPVGDVPAVVAEAAPAPEGAQQYVAMNLPPEVQTAFDEGNAERMRAGVAGAQTQMQTAADQRDQQHQAAVDQARTERDTAVQDAEGEQQARVAAARQDITHERDATVAAQQQAVERTTGEANARREADRSQIDTRVADDRRQIEGRYTEADASARREVEAGERQAEGRRQAAERDAENQSWWDRAVSFVRDAFNALVSAIGAIFDAVRRAVNAILDAARAFALALINAAASFIRDAIAAFGRFLTALVDTLLGSLFPELAAALTAFINRAVAAAQRAIDAVAEGLRAAVNAIVETLRRGINALIDAYQAAVNAAINVLRAVVTGDWAALARQVFEAVLRALGIDPAAVYEFIGRAEATVQLIIDNPGAFLGHVVDALKGGISRFADNFLAHLQAGIIGWLTGALGGAGITLPERFDLMGVLSLIQQILGLTWANLRQRIVRLVGERAVQALEFVASYVQTLIEGGWAALWERIQNDLATLRDMVLEQIRNFLVERILIAAITRLATLFNPVGALLNLVLTLYNFYTFLRDQLQRIFAVAQAIVNAVSDIARGVIDPAIQRVEGVLGSLLPLAIDLLARLIGLGNIGERVRAILQRVQDAIWRAIDRLIERVLASFRGGGQQGAAAAGAAEAGATPEEIAAALNQTLTFRAGGEEHRLMIRPEAQGAALLLASNGGSIVSKLNDYESRARIIQNSALRDRTLGEIDTARGHQQRVDQLADEIAASAARRSSPATRRAARAGAPAPPAGDAAPSVRRLSTELATLKTEVELIINNVSQTVATARTSDLLERFEYFRSNAPAGIGLTAVGDRGPFGIRVTENGIEQVVRYQTSSQRYWLRRTYLEVMRQRLAAASQADPEGQASRDLGAGIDASRLSQVGEPGSQRYAIVQPPPAYQARVLLVDEEGRDPSLVKVVRGAVYANAQQAVTHTGILAFMYSMADTGSVTVGDLQITRTDFENLWNRPANANWIKNVFRDAVEGTHEWIPTNQIREVIDRTHDARGGARVADWIGVQHNLRTDTSWVIFTIQYWSERRLNNVPFTVMNGHSGALYVVEGGGTPEPLTTHQNVFHDNLRAQFAAHQDSVNGFIDAMKTRVFHWVWAGNPRPRNIHPGVIDSNRRSLSDPANLMALAGEQRTRRDEIVAHFDQVKQRFGRHG